MSNKVLVTGASGFVGHHLVDDLISEGFEVRCLVRKTSKTSHLQGKVELVYGEVTIPESLEEAVKNVKYIIHMAAVVKALKKEDYYKVNTQGTINLFTKMLQHSKTIERFVYISSQAASKPSDVPINEDEPSSPVTNYGKSKLKSEEFLRKYIHDIPITIIRPSAVYGPEDKEFLPVYKMIKNGFEPILKDGKNKVSMVYVKDLSKSIIQAMKSPNTIGKTYFSAYPEPISIIDFYKEIEKALNKKFVLRIPIPVSIFYTFAAINTVISKVTGKPSMFNFDKVNELKNSWVCSSEKLIKDTGFKYSYDIKTGIKETINWYLERGML